jgi:mono/diheme cytochrome c family protein
MARRRHHALTLLVMTAMALAVAVMAASVAPAATPSRELPAELLILRGDLDRFTREPGLSSQNREGLRQRIAGALGLLPWLLREAGDPQAADRLRAFHHRPLADATPAGLTAELDAAIARHPLQRDTFLQPPPTPARLNEARAIHETYCAGCHDGASKGSPDLLLPARDLFAMARQEATDAFLARMVNGVKGDATIHFANPLTDAQIGALLTFYRSRAP